MENEAKQDNTFTIVNDEGKEIKCEVLFTYEDEKTKKNYMAYTDNTLDEEGNTKVYASIYNPEEETYRLQREYADYIVKQSGSSYKLDRLENWEILSKQYI